MIRAILTDIEGTATPIYFVTAVLYPYARARVPAFVRDRAADPEVSSIISEVQAEVGEKLDVTGVITQLLEPLVRTADVRQQGTLRARSESLGCKLPFHLIAPRRREQPPTC